MYARVCIDSSLPHLDTLFDYAIPADWDRALLPGTHVRVPLAGRLVSGVVIDVAHDTDFVGTVRPLRSAAAIPTFTPQALDLAQRVAHRYAGTLWDVLRLMAPPRVASVEKRAWEVVDYAKDALRAAGPQRLSESAHAVWAAPPGAGVSVPADSLAAHAVAVALNRGQCVVALPDSRSLHSVVLALQERGLQPWSARTGGDVAIVSDDQRPATRYGAYVAAMHGQVPLVVGLRRAVWQPLAVPGGIVMWDPDAGGFEERHAPYPHARAVAALRADEGLEVLWAAYAPSPELMAVVEHGWAVAEIPDSTEVTRSRARVELINAERRDRDGGAGWHWMPPTAWRLLLAGMREGVVGVVVPRTGYVTATACARCGRWAACPDCDGSLTQLSTGELECAVCERRPPAWHCPDCHHPQVKAVRQGVEAIAAHLRRMAPTVPVHVSTASLGLLDDNEVTEGTVVATPGALPQVTGGYAHVSILHAAAALSSGLGAEYHQLRWWASAVTLVRAEGSVALVGDPDPELVTALQTWRLAAWSQREAERRRELGLPPYRRTVTLTGDRRAVEGAWQAISGHGRIDMLQIPDGMTLMVDRSVMPAVLAELTHEVKVHSKAGTGPLFVRVDGPVEFAG